MANLTKARLAAANKDLTGEEGSTGFDVQLNPTSLHYSRSTATSPKSQEGSQPQQHLAGGPATLSLDLHFDTADDGSDVIQTWVRKVEQFLMPQGDGKEPPRVFFTWGTLKLGGVLRTLNVDVDLFSDTGTPLRAKVGVSIEEQLPKVMNNQAGPGAKASNAVEPGKSGPGAAGGLSLSASASASFGLAAGAGVGLGLSASASFSAGGQTAVALGGESAAAFAARVGVDPSAWRAIAAGQVDSPASLQAGVELDFSAGLSAGAGVGVSAGAEAGATVGIDSAFGLAAPRRGAPEATQAAPGFSLAAGGGVSAALATVDIVRSEGKTAATRQAFGAPAPLPRPALPGAGPQRGLASLPPSVAVAATSVGSAAPPRPQPPDQSRPALARSARAPVAPAAPPPPRPDPRAGSFGLGVPLRPRVGPAADERSGRLGAGGIPLKARGAIAAPTLADPTVAPWTVLPSAGEAPARMPVAASAAVSSSGCGSGCGCGRCGGAR